MRRACLTVLLAVTIAVMPGCMLVTQRVYKNLQKRSNPKKELADPSYADKNEVFKGTFVGTVEEKGIEYDQFQFRHILARPDAAGPPRILEVMVPQRAETKAKIFETDVADTGSKPAYWFTRNIGMKRYATSDAPAIYFRTFYPQIQPEDYRSDAINIDLTRGFLKSGGPFGGDYGYVVYRLAQAPDSNALVWKPFEAEVNIRWVVRSKTAFQLSRLQFLYSVPFDLVTFPIQMVIVPFLK